MNREAKVSTLPRERKGERGQKVRFDKTSKTSLERMLKVG